MGLILVWQLSKRVCFAKKIVYKSIKCQTIYNYIVQNNI